MTQVTTTKINIGRDGREKFVDKNWKTHFAARVFGTVVTRKRILLTFVTSLEKDKEYHLYY